MVSCLVREMLLNFTFSGLELSICVRNVNTVEAYKAVLNYIAPRKINRDSLVLWNPRCGFRISFNFGFKLMVGFRIQKLRIPESTIIIVPESLT